MSERIAQSSRRFLSSILAFSRIITASSISAWRMFVRYELFELFSTGGTTDLRQSYLCWWSSLFFDSTSPSLVTNLISKGGRGWCLNPQTWPKTLAQPRLRAHPIILQWYKFYGSFLWYPILSFQRFPFVSFFHNRILRGEYKFENKILNEIWIESNLIDD